MPNTIERKKIALCGIIFVLHHLADKSVSGVSVKRTHGQLPVCPSFPRFLTSDVISVPATHPLSLCVGTGYGNSVYPSSTAR